MVTELHTLLAAYEAERQAARPTGLTASGNTPVCERQTSLALHGAPPADPVEPVTAATVGTLIHAGMREVYERGLGAATEVPGPHGTGDVNDPIQRAVRDLKTVNRFLFDQWDDNDGPPESVWDQLAVYGHDQGAEDGWTLVVDALCRETGRCRTFTRFYDPSHAADVVADLERLGARLAEADPWAVAPTGIEGPDWVCSRCPWRTPCLGGEDDAPYVHDEPTVVAAAEEYLEAGRLARTADEMKRRARARLRGVEGRVGPFQVRWVTRVMPGYVREESTMVYPVVKVAK